MSTEQNQLKNLELWRHALIASVRNDTPDLSARQMSILLSVYASETSPTVRGLAKLLHVSKPAISRALDRLGEIGYIRRERDTLDRRNVLVRRTEEGAAFLKLFAGMIDNARTYVDTLAARDATFFLSTLDFSEPGETKAPQATNRETTVETVAA